MTTMPRVTVHANAGADMTDMRTRADAVAANMGASANTANMDANADGTGGSCTGPEQS
jgi:hypothetical protein